MSAPSSPAALHISVMARLVRRWLASDATRVTDHESAGPWSPAFTTVKGTAVRRWAVWADAYAGEDPDAAAQRDLPFYRLRAQTVAVPLHAPAGAEAADLVAHVRCAIARPADEVTALMREREEIFLDEMGLVGCELRVYDAAGLSALTADVGTFPTRPVALASGSQWCAIVPVRRAMEEAGGRVIGDISGSLGDLPRAYA